MASRVSLTFAAAGLRDMDYFSKSDPYLVLYELRAGNKLCIGRTETVRNVLAPVWTQRMEVDFRFEMTQEFVAEMYDDDGKGPGRDDFLGRAEFQLAHVVSGRHGKHVVPIPHPGKGTLTVSAQSCSTSGDDSVVLRFGGSNMKKMDFFGQADPYFKLSRILPNGTTSVLYQSEVQKNTLDPQWRVCPKFFFRDLAGHDLNAPTLLFQCWDKDLMWDDKMGQFTVSVNELIAAGQNPNTRFPLRHATKPKSYGDVYVCMAEVHHFPTFPEFLSAGLRMKVAISIDFTGSNGDPRTPQSLHYMNPTVPNQYVRAMTAVSNIVLEYDRSKLVPAFGFGAMLPSGQVSHCFHLNAQPDPCVAGIQGILDAYASTLSAVFLSGPTNFAPTIEQASRAAYLAAPSLTYQILLIITDGAITDTDATVDAIVRASALPLSIIIIGVGTANFSTMKMLDGDEVRLTDRRGNKAIRDIVQFVPFNDYLHAPMAVLAAEVLREVPHQVETWARSMGITPDVIARNNNDALL